MIRQTEGASKLFRNAASTIVWVGAQKLPIRAMLLIFLAPALLLLTACAGTGGKANTTPVNPLVGTWRRVRKCDDYVHELKLSVSQADVVHTLKPV
jgi:hypothetical protein